MWYRGGGGEVGGGGAATPGSGYDPSPGGRESTPVRVKRGSAPETEGRDGDGIPYGFVIV